MTDDKPPPVNTEPVEPMPWDRLGMFWEDVSTVSRTMATRNQELWSSTSQHLGEKTYTADDATTDAAKAMSAALASVQDVMDLWIRYPERERVAAATTTAFLLFTPKFVDSLPVWTCDDKIWMRLPSSRVEQYDEHAKIEISGPSPTVVTALKQSLRTKLGKSRQAYLLSTDDLVPFSEAVRQADAQGEAAIGAYTGSVYVTKPTTMLVANLRIVIESPR